MRTCAHGFNSFRAGEALMTKSTKIQLSQLETNTIENEILKCSPVACLGCNFKGSIPTQYYQVTQLEENDGHDDFFQAMKEQIGYSKCINISCELGDIICVMRCPQCGSENIFSDTYQMR